MEHDKLQQLKEEMQKAMKEDLDNSKLGKILTDNGFVDQIVRFEVILDLTKLESNNTIVDKKIKDSLQAIPGESLVMLRCNWCPKCC
jgi:hypothetical protein